MEKDTYCFPGVEPKKDGEYCKPGTTAVKVQDAVDAEKKEQGDVNLEAQPVTQVTGTKCEKRR